MLKTFKYRLNPNKQQVRLLDAQLEECRWLYNHLLAERRDAWEQRQESVRLRDDLVGDVRPATAGVVLLAGVAAATLAGVVTAITKRDVTVAGAVYPLEGVELQDMSGQPITLPEIRPGVAVELDFDDEGRLTTIRAAVVR